MSFDPENFTPPGAKIKVIGVGGGGGNAVNTMIRSNLDGVDFITANTDVQALRFSLASCKLQVGKELTRGLGAGADPDIGRDAALEDRHEIQEALAGADMVFITAGMGGGTGTGGAAVVAQIARELGALTVAVVTKPFAFEGKRRRKHADGGVGRLRECVDTLITIPNQRLLQVASPSLSMIDAFKMADEVLVNAVRGISDIINIPGTVNVDFADVKAVMSCMGQALMGIGAASGEHRAAEAARMAISSPLLEDIDIEGATGILINITAGSDVGLMELNEACSVIQEAAHEDALIIFGAVIDESLGGQMRVTVIATGFQSDQEETESSATSLIKPVQSIVSPYGTRLTSSSPSPGAKPTGRSHTPGLGSSYPLTTRKPEASRPQVATPEPKLEPMAAPIQPPARSPVPNVTAKLDLPVAAPAKAVSPLPASLLSSTPAAPLAAGVTAREEAQDLARWTLDPEAASDLSGLEQVALSSNEIYQEPDLSVVGEQRLTGARAFAPLGDDSDLTQSLETASDHAVFSDELDLGGSGFETPVRPGAVKDAPSFEPVFEPNVPFAGQDIDKKIDEALELAERMRTPRKGSNSDDLDVPAFLRNGMRDLPID